MEQQEHAILPSRREAIQKARESCMSNLSNSSGRKGVNYKQLMKTLPAANGQNVHEIPKVGPVSRASVIRILVALVLFAGILLWDKANLSVNGIDGNKIQITLQNSETIESIEQAVSKFTKEAILPVFNKKEVERKE